MLPTRATPGLRSASRWLVGPAAVAVAAAVAVIAAPAAAQTDPAELGVTVTAGFDGGAPPGLWLPVSVGLEPVRPVEGTLVVTSDTETGPVATQLPIDVAAASREVHRVLVPYGRVTVEVVEQGVGTAPIRPRAEPVSADYLVGFLGALPASPPPVRSAPTGRSGRWVGVDPGWPESSAQALSGLGTLVTTHSTLSGLSDAGRENIAAAVGAGLELVVVADTTGRVALDALGFATTTGVEADGGTIATPPATWTLRPSDVGEPGNEVVAAAVPAGLGRIVLTTAVPGAEDPLGRSGALWSVLAQMRGAERGANAEFEVTRAPYQFARLFSDPEGAAPSLPWLGAFVLVYVLVVGPVNGIVLGRMGRRELAWATVPLVTAVFTAGAFLGATGGRPPTGVAARLTVWAGSTATEIVAAGVRAATPGERTLTLPGGDWTARPLVDGGQRVTVARGTDTRVTMSLTALQLGGAAAWRTVTAPPPLAVTATAKPPDGVAVTVRNTGTRALTGVRIRTAGAMVRVGDLAAGASSDHEVGGAALRQQPAYRDMFADLPGGGAGVTAPSSLEAVLRETTRDRPGTVWVVGTDVGAPPTGVRAGGQPTEEKGSLVAVSADVAGPVSPFNIRRDIVLRRPDEGYLPGPTAIEGPGEAYLRFRLPPGTEAGDLRPDLGRGEQHGGNVTISVWEPRREEWLRVVDAFDGSASPVGPLGEVWVRATGPLVPFEYSARTLLGESS